MTAYMAHRLHWWRNPILRPSSPKGFRSIVTTPGTSSTFNFYQNRQLERYSAKEAKRLTLRQLLFFGRSLTEEKILTSANYVRSELPIRIAHRIRDLQALPYVVVTQEGVDKVYKLYWSAFEKFSSYPPITNMKENARFCEFVGALLDGHAVIIPNLSLGLSLSSPYLSPEKLDGFMRRMLISRISRRVLAEHHISLSKTYNKKDTQGSEEPRIGIIYPQLDAKRCIDGCTDILRGRPLRLYGRQDLKIEAWPEVHVEGHLDAKFAYIRDHFEYIVFELLKNAMTATVLKHHDKGLSGVPAVRITIVAGDDDITLRISDQGGGLSIVGGAVSKPSDLFSFSHVRNASRLEGSRIGALRTASEEGLRATVQEQILHWQHANSRERDSSSTPLQSRIGMGLPMSNIYATYFGGSLELVSLDGWGTDVFLRLPKLGTNLEGIEV